MEDSVSLVKLLFWVIVATVPGLLTICGIYRLIRFLVKRIVKEGGQDG